MDQPLIELRGVRKIFTTEELETHVLVDVDLSIWPGQYISIAGPSGCGKSTLLSILGLLDVPTSGEYLFDGRRLDRLGAVELAHVRNRRIGFVFQSFNLIGDLTVAENVALPLLYRGVSASERRAAVQEALQRVEMIIAPDTIRPNFPEGSSSGWPLPGPSWANRRSFSPTSPQGISIRKTERTSWI